VVRTIDTGGHHTEYLPIGHTANLASRIQSVAPAGSIAISHHTRALVEDYFELKSLGLFRLKGVSEPVEVHEVVGLGPLQTRLQVSAQRGFTKFVGRQAEIGHLMSMLELARSSRGRIVAIEAEAGLGKSRLLHFKRLVQDESLVLETFSVSHGKTLAYLPIIELLKTYFGIENEDAEAIRRAKINDKILSLDAGLHEVLPHMQRMLEVTVAGDPTAEMDPRIRRQRTHDAIKRILVRESVRRPLILIFEDLHWIDGETPALLDLLADSIATARILILVSHRPEYSHNWIDKSYYTQIKLDYLGTASTEEMLTALLGDESTLGPLKRLIHQRTEGNPFFIEEMVRTLFERGILTRDGTIKLTRTLSETVLPHTVQGLIASRIDLLPAPERDLLQTLSVMGRSFPLSLIGRVAAQSDEAVERMLSTLRLGQFIYEQSISSDVEYAFKHELTQEVAYRSLLAERRATLHQAIGDAKEELFAGHLEDHLGELAHHYRLGGDIEKAIKYLELMGRQALRRSAYGDALNALNGALDLLKTLPTTEKRKRKQIEIGLAAGIALTTSKGYAVPEAQDLAVWMLELTSKRK
jgi:predicted ATPase